METDKNSTTWTIIGIVVPVVLSILGVVIKMITSPKLKILYPKRVLRSWVPLLSGNKQEFINNSGTATHDYIYQMRKEEKISANDVNVRYFIHIPVYNDTVFRYENTTAKDVSARLFFYNLDGEHIGEFDAKWENADQYAAGMNKNKSKLISIHGGKTENLDIASRQVTGNKWYVMNMDSYDNPANSEVRSNEIGTGGFIVHVKPHCQNSWVKTITYKIIDNGTDEPTYILLKKFTPAT